jgi:hypothetical protein
LLGAHVLADPKVHEPIVPEDMSPFGRPLKQNGALGPEDVGGHLEDGAVQVART